jgi:nucleoside-diphosphate kinase
MFSVLLILLRPNYSTKKPQKTTKMAGNRTFTMLKPDATIANNSGAIIKMIEEAGFRIIAMKKTRLSSELAGKFYEIHKERSFYGELVNYMSSGAIVPMILEKANAVEDFRKLIGATDPKKAEPGTIRALFAKSIDANAIHGSDSDANAEIEGSFFFSQFERF